MKKTNKEKKKLGLEAQKISQLYTVFFFVLFFALLFKRLFTSLLIPQQLGLFIQDI